MAAAPDASFYKTLAQGGIADVEAGKLAERNGADSKDFGAMMVKDHSAANEQLKALAAGKGIDLPSSSSTSQMATKAKLEVMSGDTFDRSYVEDQVKAHRDTVELLKKEIAAGQDPDATAFAQKVLPTVESHLHAINPIAAAGAKG